MALFGQSRHHHKVARIVLQDLGIPVVVFEEGYFRPGFATMELGGVNGYSTTLDRYVWLPPFSGAQPPAPDSTPHHFVKMAVHATRHYVELYRGRAAFPHYAHHRSTDLGEYATYWIRSWTRKAFRHRADLRYQKILFRSGQPYYFVPLQLESDSQLTAHSSFASNQEFASEVIRSFASHAPADTHLIFKQHPHSRGGHSLADYIRDLARSHGVERRIFHISEGDTPDLAEHSMGTVLINSTVGLQAIERRASLMVMGDALYNRVGLAFQGTLDAFWCAGFRPDQDTARNFLAQLKSLTQVPVSLYGQYESPLRWNQILKGVS
ncbi:capsular biosynthesis protein [Ramlibacter aquaticus]|uniref:Capsular biosynthesis protein n=1 Tax=Ramlibacter aquaticus TaxID=2780094 RepID=A0ABR9SKA5_9BURK|nr:capsular biosynthesis protein [Ramlibacter aquaticus]MBE7942680.1 capsular biosynthesis protein [Ramlibacter aquaticus]